MGSASNDCTNAICVPINDDNAPSTKFLLSGARKARCDFVLREIETRNAPFEHAKLNSKGKNVKVGIEHLIGVLKLSVHPNQTSESLNMSKS